MKKILKLVTLMLALFSLHQLDAQEKVYKDKITLKGGSRIVGAIIDYQPGEKVTIELKNGKEVTLGDGQIKRVYMHDGGSQSSTRFTKPLKEKKIYNETEFAFLTGPFALGASLNHTVFYQHNWRFAYGAGLGVDNYFMAPGRSIYPIYANAKVNLRNGSSSPYVGMKIGYGMAFENEDENITEASGGYMANPYIGLRVGSQGLMFNLFTGLKFQKADYVVTSNWDTRREDMLLRRLVFGVSMMF